MPVHAVTGASSHVGHYAVHQLLGRGVLLGALRHLSAAAAAGRRADGNLRPCGSRLVSAGSHLFGEA